MMIFLLAVSMMVAMAASAIVLLLDETDAQRSTIRKTTFDINSLRNLKG